MWNDVMCHRAGAPPLRFLGACLSHVETSVTRPTLFLTLWARRLRDRRDIVVALSERGVHWRANAFVVTDVETAIREIEERCARMRSGGFPFYEVEGAELSPLALMEARCRVAAQERRFCELASDALDRWLWLAGRGVDECTSTPIGAAN